MPLKKNEKPLTVESIKAVLLPSIAELFETHAIRTDEKFKTVNQEIHGVKIMIEQMDKKIDTALELASTTTDNAVKVKDHRRRIEKLESEVDVIKRAVKAPSA